MKFKHALDAACTVGTPSKINAQCIRIRNSLSVSFWAAKSLIITCDIFSVPHGICSFIYRSILKILAKDKVASKLSFRF